MSTQKSIYVEVRGERDWLAREDGARKRGINRVVNDDTGKVRRSKLRKRWFARLFGR